ncbi:hypothetical protein [Sporocytophaga myxococcoides]|uniref:hypothetical protein n=1 Tax=Sporocytophaga myxococcoides TaxID=153721 RepID=UPI0004253D5E|nr:hypothetical protein [Sporocytophaga myxococcoides]
MEEQKPLPKFDPEKTADLLIKLKKLKARVDTIMLSNEELRKLWIKSYTDNRN